MSAEHPRDRVPVIDLQQAAQLAGGDFTTDPEIGMRRAPEAPRDYAEVGVKQPGRSFGDRLFNFFAKFGM